MIYLLLFILLLCLALIYLKNKTKIPNKLSTFKTHNKNPPGKTYKNRRKEQWVIDKVIYFKAMMPDIGCRVLAAVFNRQFANRETVSKSWVANILKLHAYDIAVQRREIKNKKPRAIDVNRIWGIDLTGKHNTQGKNTHIMGIIDHGSRANILLKALSSKASIQLLRCLLDSIEKYGKPVSIRTDNEAVFTSRLFRFGLWFLGIKHQTTDLHCPWQNGRIERFFGTLKSSLNRIMINDQEHLNWHLQSFRFYYNHIRPHQNLGYQTPAEVWNNKVCKRKAIFFSAWDGLLRGFWHPD